MAKKIISILTDWNPSLGHGHIQRMATVLSFLNEIDGLEACIINQKIPEFISPHLSHFFVPEIPVETALIIRDMRDSSADEILKLRNKFKIITIDDCGSGRTEAHAAIDLLPNLRSDNNYTLENIIYGYTFSKSILSLHKDVIEKDIDISIYIGHDPDKETINSIVDILPSQSVIAVLAGTRQFITIDKNIIQLQKSYSETVLSSKIIVTHFGVFLFEGIFCGCIPITLNPTQYHSDLTDKISGETAIKNFGIYNKIDTKSMKEFINDILLEKTSSSISTTKLKKTISRGCENLLHVIRKFI